MRRMGMMAMVPVRRMNERVMQRESTLLCLTMGT